MVDKSNFRENNMENDRHKNKSKENDGEIIIEKEVHYERNRRRSEKNSNSWHSDDAREDLNVDIDNMMGWDQITEEDIEKCIEEFWEEEGLLENESDEERSLDLINDDNESSIEKERTRKLKEIQNWVDTCLTDGNELQEEENVRKKRLKKEPTILTCKICFKELESENDYKIHMDSSHNEYVCTYCDIIFEFVRDATQHTKVIHEVPVQKSAKSFKCDFCKRTFQRKKRRDEHLKRTFQRKIISAIHTTPESNKWL